MFKSQNFCHIASNNRNLVKVGVFTYRTTDSLETVLTSGYFNERIIDINLHDLIIHEKISAIDSTVVERNILCVVERTLDNVGTVLIQSDWEKGIDQTIEDIVSQLDDFVLKTGDTMTGALNIIKSSSSNNVLLKLGNSTTASYQWSFVPTFNSPSLSIFQGTSETNGYRFSSVGFLPATNNNKYLGGLLFRWKSIYTGIINNGGDLIVPENTSGTLATKADVDLAANSGDQLYSTGVWYAKMYAGTTPPASAEIEGRNYADFSQTDGSGNPVIKVYTYTSGSWTLTDTIVPPAEYNGYMTITSKIWDISEQAGQQGGKVLWSHNQKTFTPYPQIISFENAALTGVSTAPTPTEDSPDNQIATKEYVDNAIGDGTITITQGGTTKGTFTTNQGGNTTIDLDAGTLDPHRVIEFQAPTAGNNYTWYRKYADGWVEQGGVYDSAFTGTRQFTFPVEMSDTKYTLTTGTGCPDINGMHGKDYITSKTTTDFSFTSVSLAGRFTVSLFSWQVSGMAAN